MYATNAIIYNQLYSCAASEEACELLQKHDFDEIERLELDLDKYVPRGPDASEKTDCGLSEGIWGGYVLRYVKRMPKPTKE